MHLRQMKLPPMRHYFRFETHSSKGLLQLRLQKLTTLYTLPVEMP